MESGSPLRFDIKAPILIPMESGQVESGSPLGLDMVESSSEPGRYLPTTHWEGGFDYFNFSRAKTLAAEAAVPCFVSYPSGLAPQDSRLKNFLHPLGKNGRIYITALVRPAPQA